jgi:geranylgeranyl pyrophosphate synthase
MKKNRKTPEPAVNDSNSPSPALDARLRSYRDRVETVLDHLLPRGDASTARLTDAMRYSTLGGGKRLRPVLVYTAGTALGAPLAALDRAAAAVELIHVYSLVHDDLPAMDDDDLRRGRPTCHRAFDEATAILAGDALQALAFEVLAGADGVEPEPQASLTRIAMIRVLADGIGTRGMAGGQAIDLAAVGRTLGAAALEDMHRRKTGALIQASVLLGAVGAGVRNGPAYEALRVFGAQIGLAFQIQDDILDVEGTTAALGKIAGADAAHNKPTYPSVIGLEASHRQAVDLCDAAVAELAPLGAGAADLIELARFVIRREN